MRWTFFTTTLLWGVLVVAGSASADGLQRFQQEVLPRIPKGDLTYDSASAVGPAGFALDKVFIRDRDRRSGGAWDLRARRLTVEEVDFDRLWTNESPHFVKLRMEGVTAPKQAALLKKHGIAEQPGDFRLEYRYDPRTRVLAVSRLEVMAPGLGHLTVEATLDNVRSLVVLEQGQWLDTAAVRSLTLTYDDQSALRHAVRGYADQAGKPEATLIREWQQGIAVMSLGKGARTAAAADALVSFLHDYRKPGGRLRLAMRPAKPLSFPLLMGSVLSADPGQMLGLDISYPSARPGSAAALTKR
jgi:hypothetical protein